MKIINKKISSDNKSIKYLQITTDEIITETAYVNDVNKHIICYASQLGCPIACIMCYNGVHNNFKRNLTAQEIIEHCSNVIEDLNLVAAKKPILFSCMGIGEPLLNYENVIDAILNLNIKYPNSRFAIATTGIKIDLIAQIAEDLKCLETFKLTISLHGSNDILRKKLIPIHSSLLDLKNAVKKYKSNTIHDCEWNYVLLNGINDSEENAFELVEYLDKDDNVKLSVFNEIADSQFETSINSEMFKKILENNDISCCLFEPQGKDIGAGCGQMVTHYLKNRL